MSRNREQQDAVWMAQAIQLAQHAAKIGEVPVGAVLVANDSIIGEGWNQPISANDPTAHAEVIALRDAANRQGNYRLPGSTLYVTIEPCTMCVGAIVHARIERLVFGASEPRAGAVCSQLQLLNGKSYNHVVEWCGGVLDQECRELMQDFFKIRRSEMGSVSN